MEAVVLLNDVLPLLLLLLGWTDVMPPHSEVTAQKLPPSEATVEALQPSVASALTPPLFVTNAQKPPSSVAPPPRPLPSEVTAVVPLLLPPDAQALAPLTSVSLPAPPTDVTALHALADLVVLADPHMRTGVSRDVELQLLLLDEMPHRGPPEV